MSYSDETIQKVWEKGEAVVGNDSTLYRKDKCKAWMDRKKYGDRNSTLGWEIDHIKPESDGGTDDLSNLRPLQWKNNASRQEGKLDCVVTFEGDHNIDIK